MTNVRFGPIGQEVYDRTYSRTKSDGSKETWHETIERVVDGNCDLVEDIVPVAPLERDMLKYELRNFNMMPAGRHLWVSGVEDRQFLFNCHVAGWNEKYSDHVCFVMDELMKGGGIGANYSQDLVGISADVKVPSDIFFVCDKNHDDYENISAAMHDDFMPKEYDTHGRYVKLVDSREGWVHAAFELLNCVDGDIPIIFDVNNIRASGNPIVGFGGTASGPLPLMTALRDIHGALQRSKGKITPFVALEIDHAIAACVIAGNVRRSARMSIMHWDDPNIFEFIHMKTKDGAHWSTNISVEVDYEFWEQVAVDNSKAHMVLQAISEGMALNGEPGIYNSSLATIGEETSLRSTNPCGEIALEEWENCNLGHINLAQCNDLDDFVERAKLMTRFLIRATFGDITSKKQKAVVNKNRRIGVGVYGAQEWIINHFEVPLSELQMHSDDIGEVLQHVYNAVHEEASKYSRQLGTMMPIKLTTVAPTGTISQLSGHTAGIHPVYAKKFIRRIRYSETDPKLQEYSEDQLERDAYSDHTMIVKHKCVDPIINRVFDQSLVESVDELNLCQQLEIQWLFQQYWADNAVSFTCNIDDKIDAEEISEALCKYGPMLKGTTVFPDKSRQQQPIERVYEEEQSDEIDLIIETDTTQDCVNGACPVR